MVKIIFFDIDDTLCRNGHLPSYHLDLLKKLANKKITLGIATGRSLNNIPDDINDLLNTNLITSLTTSNGQINQINQQIISEYVISYDDIVKLVQICRDFGLKYQLSGKNYTAWSCESLRANVNRLITDKFAVDPDLFMREPILQLSIFDLPADDLILEQKLADLGYSLVRWHAGGGDVIPKIGSKARGIKDVCNHLQIDIANAMAFGDGSNDVEMLSEVGIGVAMGDCAEILKKSADFVTKIIEENGILIALQKYQVL